MFLILIFTFMYLLYMYHELVIESGIDIIEYLNFKLYEGGFVE